MLFLRGIIQAVLLALLPLVYGQTTPTYVNTTGCIDGPSTLYVGTQNTTFSGIPCQRWDSNTPHVPRRIPHDGPNHNYCRNPDNDPAGTWCYTTDPATRWQFCHIPKCNDSSLLFMTTRASGDARLQHVPADVEVDFPNFNPVVAYNKTEGHFWSVATDKRQERVFFGDIKSDYLGIFSFETNTTTTAMYGMMKDVEQLAYDWVTQNIYFNDYKKKWIMAVEKNFQYYTIVYHNISEAYYGLALHAKRRLLYFTATNQARLTYIKAADLAGRNISVIYPTTAQTQPTTIRSLALDNTDDRLYWSVEFPGFVTNIFSCRLDGSNLTQIQTITQRTIWGIAAYLDFIYLAEHTQYYSSLTGSISYRMRVITKRGGAFRSVRTTTRLRGLAVYSDREEYSLDDSGFNDTLAMEGECARQPACDHICLPRLNARRECRCLPGYYKAGDTQCTTRFLTDNYMVVVDKAQKRIFQLSLSDDDHNYTAVDTRVGSDITAMAINPLNGHLFWYDRNITAIYKADKNGADETLLLNNVNVKSMAIEPLTGNIYYADADTQTINVVTSTGQNMKTLTPPPTNTTSAWKIETIAMDIVNKYLYWTISNENAQQAELRRMGLDGSNQTRLLWNMISAKHVMISNERKSLFINIVQVVSEENSDVLYEIPLSAVGPTGRVPGESRRYNIKFSFSSEQLVEEFIVFGSLLYFATSPTNGLQTVNLTLAASRPTIRNVVAKKNYFYNPRYISAFQPTQRNIIASLPNPCRNSPCGDLCLITPQNASVCACRNGFNLSGNACGGSSARIDRPPSYGNTCPDDFAVDFIQCQPNPQIIWTAPTWTDDYTSTSELVIRSPTNIQPSYAEGRYSFTYTAMDTSGNTGYCSFVVTVSRVRCRLIAPSLSSGFTIQRPICSNGELLFHIGCANNNLIQYGNFINSTFINVCQSNGVYAITDYSDLQCISPPTTTTPSTTTTTATTPITASTTTTTKPTTTTSSVPPTTTTPSNLANVQPALSRRKTLSTGAIVAIVLVALLVVFIVAGVIYMRVRRKNGGFGIRDDGAPIFTWNKSGDKEVANESVYHHL